MELPAPREDAVARWTTDHPVLTDAAFVLAFVLASTISLASAYAFANAPVAAATLIGTGVLSIPLRRWRPDLAFTIALVGAAAAAVVGVPTMPFALLVVASVVIDHGPGRATLIGASGVAVLVVLAWISAHGPDRAFLGAIAVVLGLLLGAVVGARRRYVLALLELAENLRVERDQRASIAVAAERRRIARDMHDVVAHGLSVMIRLADGTQAVAVADPDRAVTAAGRIAEVGRASLADMRRVLGVLRDEQSPADDETALGPQPTVADVAALVAVHRDAGLPVSIRRIDADGLAAGASTVAYRIVQECLTNAARYADGATDVTVDVHRDGDTLSIAVEDDGHAATDGTSHGSERGLVGIRERAALYDGVVEAGPRKPDGWLVHVVLHGTAAP
jgi:signal transduction histidine kinase